MLAQHRRALSLVLILGFTSIACIGDGDAQPPEPLPAAAAAVSRPHVAGRVIVKYREHASPLAGRTRAVSALRMAASTRSLVAERGIELLRLRNRTVEEALAELAADPDVEWAQPDYLLTAYGRPDDPRLSEQWHHHQDGTHWLGGKADADIDAPEAWDLTTSCEGVVVAVIDSALHRLHPDLKDNVWVNSAEDRDGDGTLSAGDVDGLDNDGNGYVDDVIGWDYFQDDNDPNMEVFEAQHGTHVFGALAARGNNAFASAGVCWRARVIPLRFMGDSGGGLSGPTSDAISAISYALAKGAKVINTSWGSDAPDPALAAAIQQARAAGALIVAAVGNHGRDVDAAPTYPSAFPEDNVIAVMGTNYHDAADSLSNYGVLNTDLGAPSLNILTSGVGGGDTEISGTSFAAPLVSGTAALIWAARPTLSYLEVKQAVLDGVDVLPGLQGRTATGGRLNVRRSLELAGVTAPPPLPVAPTGLVATAGDGLVNLSWAAVNGAASYTVKRSLTSGGPYMMVQAGLTGTSITDTGLGNGTTYYYVASASNTAGESPSSTQVAAKPTAPTAWSSQDVGAVAAAGSWSESSGSFTVRGSGADIYGTADELRYMYRTITGDATIVARVASVQNVNAWTKAGVMMRAGTSPGAANAMALVSPTTSNLYRFQRRTSSGGSTASSSGGSGARPVWLRLVRVGNNFTASTSSNGNTWSALGTTARHHHAGNDHRGPGGHQPRRRHAGHCRLRQRVGHLGRFAATAATSRAHRAQRHRRQRPGEPRLVSGERRHQLHGEAGDHLGRALRGRPGRPDRPQLHQHRPCQWHEQPLRGERQQQRRRVAQLGPGLGYPGRAGQLVESGRGGRERGRQLERVGRHLLGQRLRRRHLWLGRRVPLRVPEHHRRRDHHRPGGLRPEREHLDQGRGDDA